MSAAGHAPPHGPERGPGCAPYIGVLASGPTGTITDVEGVLVGHCTLDRGAIQTGVTVLYPHAGNLYCDKVPAAATVVNGFGKSVGLIQIDELGVLETPIALTNTFGVAAVVQAQIRAAIAENPQVGRDWPTVNPLVLECNDGYLNDIQAMAVTEADYLSACGSACANGQQRAPDAAYPPFARGAVGAGRGMSCFDLKGGIGTASRMVTVAGQPYTVGALVLANFGRLPMLTLAGVPIGRTLEPRRGQSQAVAAAGGNPGLDAGSAPEQGSIIMLLATDAPLTARQLKRLSLRAAAGLARTGSAYGHGSGDIALAFSTAYTVPHQADFIAFPPCLADARLDRLFHAGADCIEQAIVDALWCATSLTGRDGHHRDSLRDAVPDLAYLLSPTP